MRSVLVGWALLSLLFGVTAPFVDLPTASYVLGGVLYSFLLVAVSVGLSLLGKRAAAWAWGMLTAAGVLAVGLLVVLVILPPSFDVIRPLTLTAYVLAGMALSGAMAASLCGWIRFFRQKNDANS